MLSAIWAWTGEHPMLSWAFSFGLCVVLGLIAEARRRKLHQPKPIGKELMADTAFLRERGFLREPRMVPRYDLGNPDGE